MAKDVSVVVTDLDNTLFDWVQIWHEPFRAMLTKLVEMSKVPEDKLLAEIQKVYEAHGTSEYAFLIEELPSLKAASPGSDLAELYRPAIDCYCRAREGVLKLYPSVRETLEVLKDRGVLIVAYTESMAFYSRYRMRKLGLDRLVDYLYSPQDHDLPEGMSREQVRRYDAEKYELRRTLDRHTPQGQLKPNPKLLLDIIKGVGGVPEEAIYVGDSPMKDIAMAQTAGVTDVWARYGTAQRRPEYELLRRVTHWSKEDVEKEKKLSEPARPASYVLAGSFEELLPMFSFSPFVDRSSTRTQLVLEMWKKTVDVQQHFNDLELRIRNYAVTVLVAILGATAFGLNEGYSLGFFGHSVPIGSVLLGIGCLAWLAFYMTERFWYHPLLYGAVEHGHFIEDRFKGAYPEMALTREISRHSPLKVGSWTIHSRTKMDLFYLPVALLLLLTALVLGFSPPFRAHKMPAGQVEAAKASPTESPRRLHGPAATASRGEVLLQGAERRQESGADGFPLPEQKSEGAASAE